MRCESEFFSRRDRDETLVRLETSRLRRQPRHGHVPCCWQAASQVGHTATDHGATALAIHCWPPSIHCARPHGLELLAGRPPCIAGL